MKRYKTADIKQGNTFDLLSEDERFSKLKIEIKDSAKININHQHNLIREYFIQKL
jgi:hypothetical protein